MPRSRPRPTSWDDGCGSSDAAAFQLGFLIGAVDRGANRRQGCRKSWRTASPGLPPDWTAAHGGRRCCADALPPAAGEADRTRDWSGSRPARQSLPMRLRLYHHGDGARIAYREAGTGPGLALFHSLGFSTASGSRSSSRCRSASASCCRTSRCTETARTARAIPTRPTGSPRSSPASAPKCSAPDRSWADTTSAPAAAARRARRAHDARGSS